MIELLRRRNFGLLWFGGLISMTGDWVLFAALPLFVYTATGSTAATAALVAVRIVPRVAFGSLAGVLVDRWDRRRTLVATNLVHAATLLPLTLVRSDEWLWLLYAVAFVQSSLAQLVVPAEGALLPSLVERERLVAANALNALNNNLARLVGPALGGVVIEFAGLGAVVALDAASFAVAALLIAFIRLERSRSSEASDAVEAATGALAAFWRDWLAGLRLIARTRLAAILVGFTAVTAVGEGAFSTLIVPFVTDVLESDGAGFGALLSAQAVGGLVGAPIVARLGGRVSAERLLVLGAIGLGAIDLAIFLYPLFLPAIALALALMVVVGIPVAALAAGAATLTQTAVEDRFLGRLFGALGTTGAVMMLLGTGTAGLLGDRVGIVQLLVIQSAAYLVAGVVVGALLRTGSRGEGAPAPRELLREGEGRPGA